MSEYEVPSWISPGVLRKTTTPPLQLELSLLGPRFEAVASEFEATLSSKGGEGNKNVLPAFTERDRVNWPKDTSRTLVWVRCLVVTR